MHMLCTPRIKCGPRSLSLAWIQSHSVYCDEQVIMTVQLGGSISQITWLILFNEDCFIQSYGGWPSLQEHRYPASFTYWLCFVVLSMRFDYACDLAQGSFWECVKAWSPLCNPVWFVMFPFLSLLSADSWKQQKNMTSSMESAMSKSSLYARTSDYIEGESPHLPKELDHSLGIAREEVLQLFSVLCWVTNHLYFSMSPLSFWHFCRSAQVVTKEKEVLEWKMKYEDSRQEVVEMR